MKIFLFIFFLEGNKNYRVGTKNRVGRVSENTGIYLLGLIQKRDLGVLIFIEHIRKWTIKFLCIFKIRLRNPISVPLFQWWNTLGVFFLTIDVLIEVSGVCLNITNEVINI